MKPVHPVAEGRESRTLKNISDCMKDGFIKPERGEDREVPLTE